MLKKVLVLGVVVAAFSVVSTTAQADHRRRAARHHRYSYPPRVHRHAYDYRHPQAYRRFPPVYRAYPSYGYGYPVYSRRYYSYGPYSNGYFQLQGRNFGFGFSF